MVSGTEESRGAVGIERFVHSGVILSYLIRGPRLVMEQEIRKRNTDSQLCAAQAANGTSLMVSTCQCPRVREMLILWRLGPTSTYLESICSLCILRTCLEMDALS